MKRCNACMLPETHETISFDKVGTCNICRQVEFENESIDWNAKTVELEQDGDSYTGSIPQQADGTLLRYKVQIEHDNGAKLRLPINFADEYYQYYVGPVRALYCTDFEEDPAWQADSSNLWEVGAATPAANGSLNEAPQAHSGNNVLALGLGTNYRAKKTYSIKTPSIPTEGYSNLRIQYWRWLEVEDGEFDTASISVNGKQEWSNAKGNGNEDHADHEWRFQDIDVSEYAPSGSIQVEFGLESDEGKELGGWTIDDFCVVAYGDNIGPVCGNSYTEAGEACDGGEDCNADCTLTKASSGGCDASGSGMPSAPTAAAGLLVLGWALRRRRA